MEEEKVRHFFDISPSPPIEWLRDVVQPNLGVSHHLEVIRLDKRPTYQTRQTAYISALNVCLPYVFAGHDFTSWYGEAFP